MSYDPIFMSRCFLQIAFIKWGQDHLARTPTLRKKCPYLEFFWSVFSRIRTEYGYIGSISCYSVQMAEKMDQKNSEYGHFSCSAI